MKFNLLVSICVILGAALVQADDIVCPDRPFNPELYHNYWRAADKVRRQIDREVGNRCIADRCFVECDGGACADACALSGCKTANDLKHTLFNARDYVRNHRNECRNVRIVSHGGTVASRVRG